MTASFTTLIAPRASVQSMSTANSSPFSLPTRISEPLFVAWARERAQTNRRRAHLLRGLQAQPDPSEAAENSAPIAAWARGHAREKRLHANAIAQLRRG
jgi:hypothetical protein